MKIALIGYGVMGRLIETLAQDKGHEVICRLDDTHAELEANEFALRLDGADVAIDFSIAKAVKRNVDACSAAGIPLVEGTTGWNRQAEEIRQLVIDRGDTMIYGANFSIGVNLFYRIVDRAAELFSKVDQYEPFIEEQHHSRKIDSPSGTALRLKSIVDEHVSKEFSVAATRAGNIPGTHRVGFDGAADQVVLEHLARNREGFASGAVLAAEWVQGRQGCWEFTEVMDQIVGE